MIVIPPVKITDAMLIASNAPEPSVSGVLWDAGTNYSVGAVVVRSTTHRRYKNAIAGVNATPPENAPTRWLDDGPSNRWAMFDNNRSAPTVLASPLIVTVQPGARADSVAMFGLVADTAQIDVSLLGVPVYSATIDLASRPIADWYEHFFAPFRQKPSVLRTNIPPNTANRITITLTKAVGNVQIGAMIVGMAERIGQVEYGAEDDVINFSKVERGIGGEAVLIARRNVPSNRFALLVDKARINRVRELRDSLNAVPAVYAGLENDNDGYFEALLKLGFARRWGNGIEYPQHFRMQMEIEEL